MKFEILQLICALLGSLGFALIFNIKIKRMLPCALGGLLCWGVYLAATFFNLNIFIATLLASTFGAVYSEVAARLLKAPATIFLIPSIITLIPGSSLFYTMQYAVQNDWPSAKSFALETALYIGAITLGISLVSAIFTILTKRKSD